MQPLDALADSILKCSLQPHMQQPALLVASDLTDILHSHLQPQTSLVAYGLSCSLEPAELSLPVLFLATLSRAVALLSFLTIQESSSSMQPILTTILNSNT